MCQDRREQGERGQRDRGSGWNILLVGHGELVRSDGEEIF